MIAAESAAETPPPASKETRRELFELLLRRRMQDDYAFSRPTMRDRRIHNEMRTLGEPEIV